jgi:DNA-directed RNA polymerase subunit RPC12/RpoP
MVRTRVDPDAALTYACQQCGAGLSFEGVRTATCPYCASPNFVERPHATGQPDPQLAIAFEGDAAWARRQLDRWLGGRTIFADSAVRRGRIEDLRGVYLPAYLYSAVARTDYTVSIGEHYTETETYTTTDAHGKTRTQTRTVTRTEYRPLSGQHLGYVTDVIVSASAGLDNATLAAVEPYDLRRLRRFSPALVAGIHEEFSRGEAECLRLARGEAVDGIGDRLRAFMPGDGFSDLQWRTTVEWETLDPILVPVWVLAVRYRPDKPPLRVVINGQTGKIAGKVPLSWWKIALAILVLAGLIAAIWILVHGGRS